MNLVPAAIGADARRDAILDRLLALHPKLIDLSLDRVLDLLDRLGHPERMLPPTIHVAGTNGKGSVIAYLAAILRAAGCRVHVYTSPHLVRFNERIVLAGQEITDEALNAALEEVERINAGDPITFFEITTAAAFLAFSRTPADVLLLETGLGGRLDATNVIEHPALTVLTPIGRDHEQHLGSTLAEIAGEKAGILKAGVATVVGPQRPDLLALIDDRAALLGVPVAAHGRDWTIEPRPDGLRYRGVCWRLSLPAPALIGRHQIDNAGIAVACLEQLPQFTVSAEAIRAGLGAARWPARLQHLSCGPLVDALPLEWELWLDGGHNESAAAALASELANWRDKPVDLIVGMLDTKDPERFLDILGDVARAVRTIAIPEQKAAIPADRLAAVGRDRGVAARPAGSLAEAVADLIRTGDRPGRILICGSLYLAGAVLADNR